MTIKRNSNKIAYGIKHFVLDTEKELKEIPLVDVFSGSTAFIIDSSSTFILTNKREWKKIYSNSDSDDDNDSSTPDDGSGDENISGGWDGGEIV